MRSKNVGIVTWFKSENFGTNLQAFALYHKIELMGYDCFFINEFPYEHFGIKEHILYLLNKLHLQSFVKSRFEKCQNRKRLMKAIQFFDTNTNIRYAYSRKEYTRLMKDFDTFISGSDQIWNPNHFNSFYYLDFAIGKKRIAYASSIGVTNYTKEQKIKIIPLIKDFNYCGLRENSAVKLVNGVLGYDKAITVVDPTFLLSAEDWENIIYKSQIVFEEDYILCYLIGNREVYYSQIQDIVSKSDTDKIIVIKSIENPNIDLTGCCSKIEYLTEIGIEDFVALIKNAKIVCTDSFHATAISINLRKDFVEFMRFSQDDPKSQNSRIIDILERYGLRDRIYNVNNHFYEIDYEKVHSLLEADIRHSVKFLSNSLEN